MLAIEDEGYTTRRYARGFSALVARQRRPRSCAERDTRHAAVQALAGLSLLRCAARAERTLPLCSMRQARFFLAAIFACAAAAFRLLYDAADICAEVGGDTPLAVCRLMRRCSERAGQYDAEMFYAAESSRQARNSAPELFD